MLCTAWIFHFIYPIYYSVSCAAIKQEQRTIISDGKANYTYLQLDNSFFKDHYDADEKELEINGTMYDVVRVEKKGTIILCTVLADNNESRLNAALALHVEHEKTGKITHTFLLWCPVAYIGNTNYLSPTNDVIDSPKHSLLNNPYLSNGYGQLPPHPPQVV